MSTTIQQVIDLILAEIPQAPFEETVDTVKTGDPSNEVQSIVSTFMATIPVIEQARALGANFIITHEPVFFNHEDKIDWLADDPIFQYKYRLLQESGITIWRFHDYWHSHRPDGIQIGFAKAVGWEAYMDSEQSHLYHLPPTPLKVVAANLKQGLDMPALRLVGDLEMTCQHVAALLGAPGPEWQLKALQQPGIDLVLCGETSEWQVCEYARDANASGTPKAVIVLGHEPSEEAGMGYLADWLTERLPGIRVNHIPSKDPLTVI